MTNETGRDMEQIIPNFIAWCSENELELPLPVALAEKLPAEEITAENRKRTGAKEGLYPAQYYAGQYPSLWKVPAAADAPYYQSINKSSKN